MGRYQAYPEYKDSGVEWIGEIPIDWDMWKISHACNYIASGTTPKSDDESKYYGGEILWVTTGELRENIVLDTQKKVTERAIVDMPTLRVHPQGSVSIAMYGATIGRLGIFGKEATTNQACCVMPPSNILFNKYLFYWLFATRQEIINLSSGGGQPNVNQEKIASLKVSAPAYELQQKIANFLDHETAKIDTLIEKQQQLIQLLKEKRQAVISHAVTKGLNPNAPMKDSGVEWLGEVPEGWIVCRLKQIIKSGSSISYGIVQPGDALDDGVPFVQTTNMSQGNFNLDELQKTTEEIAKSYPRSRLDGGEVILGIRASIGAAFVVPEHLKGANLSRGVARIIPNESVTSSFLVSYFRTDSVERYWSLSKQGSTFSEVSIETVRELTIPVPPISEQTAISKFVKDKLEVLENIIERALQQQQLLQERRTALISAAVTGKIDVRHWQAPQN